MKRLLVLIIFLSNYLQINAQNLEFKAYAPSLVAIGEQFRLTYSVNKRPSEFTPPEIKDFEILAGPSTSSSSSVQIINGKVSQSESYTYTYILVAQKEGKFTIEPAEVVVDKEKLKSNILTIDVVKQAAASQSQDHDQQRGGIVESNDELPNSELFVAVDVNRRSSYLGEPIIATIKLYTRVGIAGFEDVKFPSFNGFWSQELETPTNIDFQRAKVNGTIYNVGVIRKYLLFPQKSDKLEIDPFELVVVYQQRANRPRSIFDDFFGAVESFKKKLVSKSIPITIKDLPKNAPESFKGAVGTFKLDVTSDKKSVKTNEAITLKVKIAGSGNVRLIESPQIEFPAGFEVFDPKTTDNINNTSEGAVGSKLFEYVAIPRTPGEFNIPAVEYSYFDPSKEQYISLKSNEITLKVSTDGADSSALPIVGYGKEDIKFIGKDIRYIKTDKPRLHVMNRFFFGSSTYYISILLVLILFALAIFFFDKHRKEMSDIMLIKNKRANKIAKKRLQHAENYLKNDNKELFFEEIHKALIGYLSDKLKITIADLTTDRAKDELIILNIDMVDIDELVRIVSVCEFARFAPKTEHSEMSSLYQSAHQLISKLEQLIKK